MIKRFLQYFLNFLISLLTNFKDRMSETKDIIWNIYKGCNESLRFNQENVISVNFTNTFLHNIREHYFLCNSQKALGDGSEINQHDLSGEENYSKREYFILTSQIHDKAIGLFFNIILCSEKNYVNQEIKEDLYYFIKQIISSLDVEMKHKYKKGWREFILRIINGLEVSTTVLYHNFSTPNRTLAISQLYEIEKFIKNCE